MRALLLLSALAGLSSASAAATFSPDACFQSREFQGFRPIDQHAFIVRANLNAYFRIDVQGSCPELTYPGAALVTVVRGSDTICGPLDWDLRVGQLGPGGFAVGCIVKSQRRLTPAEVAALPASQKP